MDYKEKMKRYREGTLKSKEKKELEEEIEKIKELSDFIYEIEDHQVQVPDNEKEHVKKVKGAINKKVVKAGVITSVAVIAAILLLTLGLSALQNVLFYNPSKKVGKETEAINMSLNAFSELHCTDTHVGNASVEKKGFGRYLILAQSTADSYSGFKELPLKKGKFDAEKFQEVFQDAYTHSYEFDRYEYSGMPDTDQEKRSKRSDAEDIKELKKMPKSAYVTASVLLKKDITLNQLYELDKKYKTIPSYGAVNWGVEKDYGHKLGFSPDNYGFDLGGDYDEKKYPYFSGSDISKPKQWEQHFKSLIKVMIDDEEFSKAVPQMFFLDQYKDALKYVEKNGIKVYALVFMENPDKLLQLKKDPLVDLITIRDVKVSVYSR